MSSLEHCLELSRDRPDARLAVMSGLRRWSEPASSQLLVAIVSIIVSVIAIAVAIASVWVQDDRVVFFGVAGAGIVYLVLAINGIALAVQMNERRTMAHVWLRALEDGIAAELDKELAAPRAGVWKRICRTSWLRQ